MVDCENLPSGSVVPVECRPVRAFTPGADPVPRRWMIGGSPSEIRHVWANDGWTPFDQRFVMNQDGGIVLTPSVNARRGRITANANGSGNHREWFLHGGSIHDDVEVEVTLWPPSAWAGGNSPQQGIVLRAQPVPGSPGTWRGFVVWINIIGITSQLLANTWQANGSAVLTQGSGSSFTGPSLDLIRRRSHVRYARRLNAFDAAQYWCVPDPRTPDMWGLVDNDLVNITSMTDGSFNRTGVAVANLSTAQRFFQVLDTTANDNIDALAAGIVDFASLLKSHWPRRIGVRLVDDVLTAKWWRPEDQPPDWGNAVHVATLIPPTSPPLPEGLGLVGLVAGHVHSSNWLEYGDLTIRPL